MRQAILILLAVITLSGQAVPQGRSYSNDPAEGLKIATIYYENREYGEAYRRFSFLAEKYPSDSHTSIFFFMAAKSLYKAGDYKEAIKLWDNFEATFPGSEYLGEAALFKGHSFYMQKRYEDAAGEYIGVINSYPKSEAARLARENLSPLLRQGLGLKQLQQLLAENPSSTAGEMIEYTLARREMDAGHYRTAAAALKAFMSNYPGSKDFKQARLLLQEAREKSENEILIGLLAPTSGSYMEYGRSMVEGASLAIDIFRSDGFSVDLTIKDTEGDPILAAKVAKSIADEEPIAVIGPLRSESALSAAIVLDDRDIPMISPTASEAGISSIGPNIFQISPSVEKMGEALARYAVTDLNINDFAIIAPDDVTGTRICNAFAEMVYKLGGEVMLTSYYTPGSTDFKNQIMPLRDILVVKAEEQLASGKLDSFAFFDSKTGRMLDRDEWPVKVGGLFLPGYGDDLKLLIPQIRYHVIHGRLLGSDSWDSEELIREVGRYIDDAVFVTDFHTDLKGSGWTRFSKAYSSAYNHPPDKVAALTYDAVRLVLEGIRKGSRTSEALREYIDRVEDYQGVSGAITFKGGDRANSGVAVYTIDGKRLGKIR